MSRRRLDYDYVNEFLDKIADIQKDCPSLDLKWYEDALGVSYMVFYNWRTMKTPVPKYIIHALQSVHNEARAAQTKADDFDNRLKRYRHEMRQRSSGLTKDPSFKTVAEKMAEPVIQRPSPEELARIDAERKLEAQKARKRAKLEEQLQKQDEEEAPPELSPETIEANRLAAERFAAAQASKRKPVTLTNDDEDIDF